ncbi:MAG: hypothetical protein KDE53_38770, partial [Caldilineaceae bacterium]|nr:hypothetical protein [Caldilineaceae bacterium]
MSNYKRRVGEVRPSQLLYTYGIGAIVDLPEFSVLVMGLDDWSYSTTNHDPDLTNNIEEERLLAAVRTRGPLATVQRLLAPPVGKSSGSPMDPDSELDLVGVQVATFPRWLVCPTCRLLASIDSGHFELKAPRWRSNRAYYVHRYCTNDKVKEPTAIPARFLVACENGHLDDFPWIEFVHSNQKPCSPAPRLSLIEQGPSGEARDLLVRCHGCNAERRLAEAFGRQNREKMPFCTARRPHLRDYDPKGCENRYIPGQPLRMRPLVLGASNTWFPLIMSSIAIPGATTKIDQIVAEDWATIQAITALSIIPAFRAIGQLGRLSAYSDDDIWAAIQRRQQPDDEAQGDNPLDLKLPEWQVFTQFNPDLNSDDFRLRPTVVPLAYTDWLDQVILVEKLREVQVLTGFTRLDSPGEVLEMGDAESTSQIVPLTRKEPTWLPAAEVRGEGIFLHFNEARVQRWLRTVSRRGAEFHQAHMRWRSARFIANPEEHDPGMRYVLLHSFAHALMRQMAMESGYTAASVRERI